MSTVNLGGVVVSLTCGRSFSRFLLFIVLACDQEDRARRSVMLYQGFPTPPTAQRLSRQLGFQLSWYVLKGGTMSLVNKGLHCPKGPSGLLMDGSRSVHPSECL